MLALYLLKETDQAVLSVKQNLALTLLPLHDQAENLEHEEHVRAILPATTVGDALDRTTLK